MDDTVYLIPREGLRVTDERGEPLPAEGQAVTLSTWWLRREMDGDVTRGDAPKKKGKE